MNKKLAIALVSVGTVIILALVWALVFVASNPGGDSSGNANSNSTPTTVTRTLSGKDITEDRADVYKAAVELLDSTGAPAAQEDYIAMLKDLDSATVKDVPKEFLDKVRFVDLMDQDELKVTTYQALITFASLAKASSEDGKIASLFADGPMTIMVDQEAGVAQVPVNIFVNQADSPNTFSMEFIYIDGEWKFAPYSVLDQLRLSLAMQQQIAATEDK